MHRTVTPELLDTDAGTPQEVQGSLADLAMINRYFGGIRTMANLVLQVAGKNRLKSVSWLDVGGGSGALARLASQALSKKGIEARPVLLDRSPGHMAAANDAKPAPANGYCPSIGGDALALPLRENSMDVVGCCLFIHHLEPPQVIEFVNQALRIARHAVLINDLVRHPLHLGLAYAGYALYRSRLTRHDSIASVRRAYTVDEMEDMLHQTSAARIEVRRSFLFRMGAIAWKTPPMI